MHSNRKQESISYRTFIYFQEVYNGFLQHLQADKSTSLLWVVQLSYRITWRGTDRTGCVGRYTSNSPGPTLLLVVCCVSYLCDYTVVKYWLISLFAGFISSIVWNISGFGQLGTTFAFLYELPLPHIVKTSISLKPVLKNVQEFFWPAHADRNKIC